MIIKTLNSIKQDYGLFFLLFFSLTVPLWQKISTIVLLLFVGVSLLKVRKIKIKSEIYILVVLYIIFIIFQIINSSLILKVMEMKAPLIAIPILFYLNDFQINDLKKAARFFIFGLIVACVLCFTKATVSSFSFVNGFEFKPQVLENNVTFFLESSMYGGNYYFGNHFSFMHQSIYFAMFLNLGIVIVLFTNIFKTKLNYIIVLLFGLVIYLISNRVNSFIFIIIVGGRLLNEINSSNKIKSLMIMFLVVLVSSVVLLTNPRTNKVLNTISNFNLTLDREADDSFGTRLLVWDASIEVVKRNPFFGVGSTNSYDALKKIYKEKRYVIPYRNRLNSHNEFLQIIVETGLVGFFVLIMLFFRGFKINNYEKLSAFIMIVFIINCLFEAILNRYSGLICFSLFFTILLYIKQKQKEI